MRIALERLMARLAGERATDDDIGELEGMVEEMRQRVEVGDLLGYSELNARFHRSASGPWPTTRWPATSWRP